MYEYYKREFEKRLKNFWLRKKFFFSFSPKMVKIQLFSFCPELLNFCPITVKTIIVIEKKKKQFQVSVKYHRSKNKKRKKKRPKINFRKKKIILRFASILYLFVIQTISQCFTVKTF